MGAALGRRSGQGFKGGGGKEIQMVSLGQGGARGRKRLGLAPLFRSLFLLPPARAPLPRRRALRPSARVSLSPIPCPRISPIQLPFQIPLLHMPADGPSADPDRGPQYEDQHVHQVYEQIASHFSETRYKVLGLRHATPYVTSLIASPVAMAHS